MKAIWLLPPKYFTQAYSVSNDQNSIIKFLLQKCRFTSLTTGLVKIMRKQLKGRDFVPPQGFVKVSLTQRRDSTNICYVNTLKNFCSMLFKN